MKISTNLLTARQQQFCQHYVGAARHNSALATRMAGYAVGSSHVTGCQLLQKPKIAAVVRGLEEVAAKDMGVTRQRVMYELVGAFETAKLMESPASMIASMRQIALLCGYYQKRDMAEKKSGLAAQAAVNRMERMTDSELLAVIASGDGGGEPKDSSV